MAVITLSLAAPKKYGMVEVLNPDGSFNREFQITTAEREFLCGPGERAPVGVFPGEKWIGSGKDHIIGDMDTGLGRLRVKYAERLRNGRLIESWLIMEPGEWSGVPPVVTASQAALDSIPGRPIRSIIAGVMVTT